MHDTFLLSLRGNSAGRRRTVAVTEDQALTLEVHLEDQPWSSFQWQVGKRGGGFADIEDGSTKPAYEILRTPLGSDGAIFRCLAFQSERVRHSQELRLRVLPAAHPLRSVYTLEDLIAAKHTIEDFHQIEFFELWNLLPASARRTLLRGMEEAALRAGKPTLLSAVEDLLSPALGRPLNPLLADCRAEDLGGLPVMPFLLGSVGFIRTTGALTRRLDAALQVAHTCSGRFAEAATAASLRALMAGVMGEIGALESVWAILDTAEWAPLTLARVSDAASREQLLALCRQFHCPVLTACVESSLNAASTRGLIDLAMRSPAATHRPPVPVAHPEEREVLRAVTEMSARNPRRYWSAREIKDHLSQQGKGPAIPAVLSQLDDLTGDGPLEWRKHGAEIEYRVRVAGPWNRRLDPAAIVWHGLHRSQIPRAAEFRRQGDTHLLHDQWKALWRLRLAEEARSAGKNQDDIYAVVVDQLLALYEALREHAGTAQPRQLMEVLQERFGGDLLIDDVEALERGLRWLALKGFAMSRQSAGWTVRGLGRRWFLDVYVAGWPELERLEWERLRDASQDACDPLHREEPAHMQRRLELILAVNEVLYEEFAKEAGAGEQWDLTCHKPNGPFLDAALYDCGRRLGVEPVLLRTGSNRVQLEPPMLKYIHDLSVIGEMSLARRLVILRRLAGFSRAALAEAIGVSQETVVNLETAEVDEFHDPRKWRRLAEVLGVDLFVVLAGMERARAVASIRTFEARLKLFCQAEGLLVNNLQRDLRGWSAQASRARRGMALHPAFRATLVSRFEQTCPSETELFGVLAASMPVGANGKPRGSAGKFESKSEALPEAVMSNILSRPELEDRAARQQGFFTIRDYVEVCAKGSEVSEGTFRRTFAKLVAGGDLQSGRPEGLHGSVGYRAVAQVAAAGLGPRF